MTGTPTRSTQGLGIAYGYSESSEPDPDDRLIEIIDHISSETTGAMHKEGITELHHFLKEYPHKKPKVDKLLDATGTAFRKYIARALASRAAEDEEREVAVADTLHSMLNVLSWPIYPDVCLQSLNINGTQRMGVQPCLGEVPTHWTQVSRPHRSGTVALEPIGGLVRIPRPLQKKTKLFHDYMTFSSTKVDPVSAHSVTLYLPNQMCNSIVISRFHRFVLHLLSMYLSS